MNICVVVCQRFASELNIEKVRNWMNVNQHQIDFLPKLRIVNIC